MMAKLLPQDHGPSRFPQKSEFKGERESFAFAPLSLSLMDTQLKIPGLVPIAFKHPRPVSKGGLGSEVLRGVLLSTGELSL